MKKVLKITILLVIIIIIFWLGSIARCEYLTMKYGNEITIPKEVSDMIGEKKKIKIINYTEKSAKVYYVNDSGNLIYFVKKDDQWVFDSWETVWSKSGSADSFVWPYFR